MKICIILIGHSLSSWTFVVENPMSIIVHETISDETLQGMKKQNERQTWMPSCICGCEEL